MNENDQATASTTITTLSDMLAWSTLLGSDAAYLPFQADLSDERARLNTFVGWPLCFLSPARLARNGFYYLGRNDEVRCAFCKVEIMKWMDGDDPEIDHRRWAPQCPFLRKRHPSNNVNDVDDVNNNVDDGDDGTLRRHECINDCAPVDKLKIAHPQYAIENSRLKTFDTWPRFMRQKSKYLADAGFFYTGHSDKVKCFYCDIGVYEWQHDDDPWKEHAKWSPRCNYLLLCKGAAYVQKVISDLCLIRSENSSPVLCGAVEKKTSVVESNKTTEENEKEEIECKICFDAPRDVCFVPCGHVIVCAKCALSLDKCPSCRAVFNDVIKLYYS
ncbi:iap3 [Lambdina fiscellaria nucleopolyhedrovirus]|uniref:Iap3 n=1 Tax=Lambdina fiscellaria nucleopolyhedrovirus TaxID=1642929 RepID=A0A0E3Z5Z8_9ABAC|nr:iap3 [Lambdina fiscellaria nucleopolyhedrovirus]AKC91666.1 iap3 [Lambdina fiscellaria nucleopolyhedrovirus]